MTARRVSAPLRSARTCYDHLAGRAGVALLDALERNGVVAPEDETYRVTRDGERWLMRFGVDVAALARGRRALVHACPDWTERRLHLAGALGAAITARLFELGWIERTGTSRAVRVTTAGRQGLAKLALGDRAERASVGRAGTGGA